MAKSVKVTGIEATPAGARLTFERLGERFVCDLDPKQAGGAIELLMGALASRQSAYRFAADEIAFSDRVAADGAPPPLLVGGTAGQIIVLDLTWKAVTALSQLATAMLEHSPTPDRPT